MTTWAVTLHDKVIKQFTISEGSRLVIGRSKDADVVIDNTAISREHTSIELRDGVFYLSDLKSLNGTFVNGKKIDAADVPIATTDSINVGKFQLVAAGEDASAVGPSLSSSDPSFDMDMDDATVFVSSSKAKAAMDRSVKDKPQNMLKVFEGSASLTELSLDGKTSIKIGKDPSCDMVISGFWVGSAQCYIIQKDKKYILIPQKCWAKTILNGTQIKNEHVLRKGDIIQIKQTKMKFE